MALEDIHRSNGSFLRLAYDDWRNSAARKVSYLAADTAEDAVTAFRAAPEGGDEWGNPSFTGTLPVASIHVERWGRSKDDSKPVWRVVADYSPRAIGPISGSGAEALVEFSSAHEQITTYTVKDPDTPIEEQDFDEYGHVIGRPATPALRNESFRPIPRLVWRPVVRMIFRTTLSSNPIGVVADRLKTINDDSFAAGGYLFAPLTVRFDDCAVHVTQAGLVKRYAVVYAFTICTRGWYEQVPAWRTDPDQPNSPPKWTVYYQLQYPPASFTNPPFPYGT